MSGAGPWGWHRLERTFAERLVADAHLPPGALVLDIGAGDGAITDVLVDAGCRVVAVELHPGRADVLRRRFGDRVTVVRADAGRYRVTAGARVPRRAFTPRPKVDARILEIRARR